MYESNNENQNTDRINDDKVFHERKTVISKNNTDNIMHENQINFLNKNNIRSCLNSNRINDLKIDDLIQIRHSSNNSQNKD